MEKDFFNISLSMEFMTSIDAVKSVLNIPMSTIKNELRKNNYPTEDTSSNCIDEKMLDRFAELYKKHLKRYFLSCKTNLNQLTKEEYDEFIEFCTVFSKDGAIALSWRKIDKEAIRDNFFRELENYNAKSFEFSIDKDSVLNLCYKVLESRCVDNLPVIDVKTFVSQLVNHFQPSLIDHVECNSPVHDLNERRIANLSHIKHSKYYRSKLKKSKFSNNATIIFRRKVYACCRLHIMSDDGNDGSDIENAA